MTTDTQQPAPISAWERKEGFKAAAFLDDLHKQSCYEQGEHHLEVDTPFSRGADAIRANLAAPQPTEPCEAHESNIGLVKAFQINGDAYNAVFSADRPADGDDPHTVYGVTITSSDGSVEFDTYEFGEGHSRETAFSKVVEWHRADLANRGSTQKGNTALEEFFDWIKLHSRSVLATMSKREASDFTESFGKAQGAVATRPAVKQPDTHTNTNIMALVAAVPPMPPTADRRPYEDDKPNGYLEGNRDWADNNDAAVTWLADNHASIRAVLTHPENPRTA